MQYEKVAILQSNYIPWKGYFDIIHDVDLFVFYDDVQYTKNDWRNRNKIKTPSGTQWLTIPTGTDLNRLICDVPIFDTLWTKKHWKTLLHAYQKADCFKQYYDFFQYCYLEKSWNNLSELNQFLIRHIAKEFLGINTQFMDSREFSVSGNKTERLVEILKMVNAKYYLSGPAGKSYLDKNYFQSAGIEIQYKNYDGYPEYSQLYPPFEHFVSILDVLFHCGKKSSYYIWEWRFENIPLTECKE
ncbi:MAG TPA: WbqC family protein [Gammaproteobacteria bacterium]|nr:WbqC family protein [Gammaproteobacteria bacterium]